MKVWVIWAFSTGKTTLVEKLWEKLNKDKEVFKICTNIEREIADLLRFDFNNHTLWQKLTYQKWLLQAILNELNYNNMVTDTPIHLLNVYCHNPDLNKIVDKYKTKYDILFYLPIEFAIEDDGVRHVDVNYQKQIDDYIKKELIDTQNKNKDIVIRTLRWDLKTRLDKALYWIEQYKKGLRWAWYSKKNK